MVDEAPTAPRGTVIFLHGHDDDPVAMIPLVDRLLPEGFTHVVPHGPIVLHGRRSWWASDDDGVPDPQHVRRALDAVDGLVAAHGGFPGLADPTPGELILAGYSQGAALALLWALRSTAPEADPPTRSIQGLVAMAGWLPAVEGIAIDPASNRAPRILIAHGTDDEVVPLPLGRSAARLLERNGIDVTFIELDAGHELGSFVDDVREWLTLRR